MAGFIKKWIWKLSAQKVPVVRLANQAHTIEFMGYLRKRENSLIDPWNQRGYEIRSGPVEIIVNGKKEMGYAVDEAGITVEFKRDIRIQAAIPVNQPLALSNDPFQEIDDLLIPKEGYINYNWEGVIGKLATLDDINEGLDLGKSMKNTIIGLAIGIPIGWILTAAMK
jgi:hypothetical protein